ncbi:MAG: alpha-galactosidase [Reichenbachiella sp.]|uniref:glycoside hydrolase family 36 protein n=1 Tax=Reichenbachiella sp. TaxID=2184521 RepID=UPI003265F22B
MKIKLKRIAVIILTFTACTAFAQKTNQVFNLGSNDIVVNGEFNDFKLEIEVRQEVAGVEIATLTLTSPQKAVPSKFSLKWGVPSNNIAGYWSSHSFLDKTIAPDWGPSTVRSMLAREAPVICLFGHDDSNRQTFAVSEVLNTVISTTAVREEDGMMYNEIQFFTEKNRALSTYRVEIRLDSRPVPYSQALNDVADWWASFEQYTPAQVPEVARMPVYSSWYSYHQNVAMEPLLKECKLAKEMGFESIIIDDGWQTMDSNRGYAYTGDWEPERIPEMKEFVKAVHDLGMKFILWYAVPFVGEKSKAFERMKGKTLSHWKSQGTYVLDPRFPEVRKFIIATYVKAVEDWDLDGFKLDFMARFTANKDTKLVANDGRDYASVNEATDVLMTELMSALRKIKPDIMIEFRRPYVGPAMRKYGNMFRADDCPNVATINRIGTSDLKMLSGNTAVHADMLMWHYDEPVETAALQLLNVMFSVPQISVRLADIPEDHFKMIQFYTAYWLKNRKVLLDGQFHPSNPLMNYPMLSGWSSKKKITTVFADMVVPLEILPGTAIDIINAKSSKKIVIDVKGKSSQFQYTIQDCLGKETMSETVSLQEGVFSFEVPPSGLISFTQLD